MAGNPTRSCCVCLERQELPMIVVTHEVIVPVELGGTQGDMERNAIDFIDEFLNFENGFPRLFIHSSILISIDYL
jgi:hypothetical protein